MININRFNENGDRTHNIGILLKEIDEFINSIKNRIHQRHSKFVIISSFGRGVYFYLRFFSNLIFDHLFFFQYFRLGLSVYTWKIYYLRCSNSFEKN